MPDLTINGKSVRVEAGATVLAAAEQLSVEIPTLCHLQGHAPETSCMLCVVKNRTTGQLLPACSVRAADGMEIDTECDEVQAARRDILNLLLSEHVGDCEAPCTRICPAHLDIPRMLRAIEHGRLDEAARIAQRDLAIPSILGYVCPAPCEKGCRRGQVDSTIAIRAQHRDLGGAPAHDLPPMECGAVAVAGSGPAGLGCAWQLRLMGFSATVFDTAPHAGGWLRTRPELPAEVLDGELARLTAAGIAFRLGESVPSAGQFMAVLEPEEHKLAVKAVANGKAAAQRMQPGMGAPRFDSRIGTLRASEAAELRKNCSVHEATLEAARCLHCDCRRPVSCKLRRYAGEYGADQRAIPAAERGHVQLVGHSEAVVFEPGKCIKCGLCIKITRRAGETLGLAFIGRGFNTRVTVPFGESLQSGLKTCADAVVAACPTGALAFRAVEE